eukprot:gb/GECG01016738.1/.p1 GENE.gb/GECG01016738.1/~~gb/GECG01016738.1/.p1  ORF type:complete len:466 (+),score=87.66 gb/GECG01016738.1/:1-1398(+)
MSESGEEYEYEDDDDLIEYGSDDSGGLGMEEEDDDLITVENTFYEAEEARDSGNKKEALEKFQEVINLEKTLAEKGKEVKTERSFPALTDAIILQCALGNKQNMRSNFDQLLSYLHTTKVTSNQAEEAVNRVLKVVEDSGDFETSAEMYRKTIESLKSSGNESLWFATQLRLAKTYLNSEEYENAQEIAKELHNSLKTETGEDDPAKSTKLVEVYALRIHIATASNEHGDLEKYYEKVMGLKSAIPDSRTLGGIYEVFGRMHMAASNWTQADEQFFDAMRFYMDAGEQHKAVMCLKYKVLANMVAGSNIDPFDSQEAKQFESHPEIVAMVNLRKAYETQDVERFESILNDPKARILSDNFIQRYFTPLLYNFRSQVLRKIITPYVSVNLSFLAKRLKVTTSEVEKLLVKLILDGKLSARLDQKAGVLRVDKGRSSDEAGLYGNLKNWTNALAALERNLDDRLKAK